MKQGMWTGLLLAAFLMMGADGAQAHGEAGYARTDSEKQFDDLPGVRHRGPVMQVPLPEGVSFDDAVFSLESEAEGANLNIVSRQNLGKAIAARRGAGGEPFPAYVIFNICNLTIGEKIIEAEPAFGAFLPCKVVLYEETSGGKVWVVSYKPAFALAYFPEMPVATVQAAQKVGDLMFDIIYRMATDQ